MIEEYGIINKIENNIAYVTADRTSMCNNCPSKGVCHPFGENENKIEIKAYNKINAKIGDKVKVIIDEKKLLKASIVVYGFPVIVLIIFSIIGKILFKKDIFSFLCGFGALIISFLLIKFYDEKNREKFKPEIVEIISENSCNQ